MWMGKWPRKKLKEICMVPLELKRKKELCMVSPELPPELPIYRHTNLRRIFERTEFWR